MVTLSGRFGSFCQSTSCHGFAQLATSRHLWSKIFWTLLIISLGFVLAFNTGHVISNYFDSTARWTTSISEEYNSMLPHPTIIICNFNKYRKTSIEQQRIPRSAVLMRLSKIQTTRHLYSPNVSEMENPIDWENVPGILEGLSVDEIFDNLGHSCEQTIKLVRTNINFERGTQIMHPCTNSSKIEIDKVKPLDLWQMCIKVRMVANSHMYTMGPSYGTEFLLDLEPDEYLDIAAENSPDVGFLIQLINDDKIEYGNWINLSPGFHTWIAMNRVEHRPGEAFDSFFKPPCVANPTMKFNDDMYYTKEMCQNDCSAIPLVNKCGCYIGDTSKIRSCMSAEEWACISGPKPQITPKTKKEIDACLESCGDQCTKTSNKYSITYSRFPSQTQLAELQQGLPHLFANKSIKDIRKRYVLVDIFYNSAYVTVIEWRLRNSMGLLLSNLGGQMGLFLGMSIISIIHALIHFCIQPFAIRQKKVQVKSNEETIVPRKRKLTI